MLALGAAFELNDREAAERIIQVVEALPPGRSPQVVQAQASRFRARLAAGRGEGDEAERLQARGRALRQLAIPSISAIHQLDHAELLVARGRAAEAEQLLLRIEGLRGAEGPAVARCDAVIAGA